MEIENSDINSGESGIESFDSSYAGMLKGAMEAINGLNLPPEVKEGLSSVNNPRMAMKIATAMSTLALVLSACSGSVNAGTEENKTPEVSNDPTTSEQLPMQEEPQESVESYDEDGEVPVGEFVYEEDLSQITGFVDSDLEIQELNEEISSLYDLLKDAELVETKELLQNIQITGNVYAISIPIKDNVYPNYGSDINFFEIEDSRWSIDRTFILEKDGQQFRVMEVEYSNSPDSRIFLIENQNSKIETIPDNYLEESKYQIFEDVDDNLKLSITEVFGDLSSLQAENGTVWISENLDNIFNSKSLNQLNIDELTEEESVLLEETLKKVLVMIKSLDNSNQNRYYGIDIWPTSDDLIVTYSLERLNPEGQLEKLGKLSQLYNQEGVETDDNSLPLTKDVYGELVSKFIKDPGDISFFVENSDMKELQDLIRLQEIVNSYDENGDMNFQQYILSIKSSVEKTDSLYNLIDALSNYKELDDVSLAKFLHDEIPSLNIIDIPKWSVDNSSELIPEDWRERLKEYKDQKIPGNIGRVGTFEYNGVGFAGDIPLRVILESDLVFNIQDPIEDSDLIIIVDKIKTDMDTLLLGTTMEGLKWEFFIINEENADEILGSGHRFDLGVFRDIT